MSSSLLRGVGVTGAYFNTNLSGAAFGPLGISLDSQSQVGFDVLFSGGVNSAFLSATDSFYGVDLTTGRSTLIGRLGIDNIRGIATAAVVPEPTTWAMLILGFGVVGGARLGRRRGKAGRATARSPRLIVRPQEIIGQRSGLHHVNRADNAPRRGRNITFLAAPGCASGSGR